MEFTVNTKALKKAAGNLLHTQYNLRSATATIDSVAKSLDTTMNSYSIVSKRLLKYNSGLKKVGTKTTAMQRGLIDISGEYLNTESKIIDSESKLGKAAWAGVMAGLGPIGNVIDAGKATIEGNYGKTVSKIIDLVGDVKKNTEGGHIKWRDMFGLDVVTDPLAKGIEKAKGKLTSGWEWAAAVVENGWDNYEEHGKFSSRFFEETAVESAIDIGKGALIAVGVGAAAAAVGISAPAWAIGAAGAVVAVGVDAGLNAIVRWATDNPKADWKEGASDFICDTGEKVFKETKKVVNGAVKSVKKGWNSFVNSVTSRGSSTGWGRLAFY